MKIIKIILVINLVFFTNKLYAQNSNFEIWKKNFSVYALNKGISQNTIDETISKTKFLPDVIKYDRYQPEFYEDTKTYINKRTSNNKLINGKKLFNKNKETIIKISNKYVIDKNLLLSLMGIETNFGKYLGKMDILSSLATLSYDKRRSEFFTSELITLLKLVDEDIIDINTLYGSWAGAFGNFQFMPTTINSFAIDYNNDEIIDLKNIEDSFASAANYLKNLGWENKYPCFFKVKLKNNIPLKYLNTSAKKIHSKNKVSYFKKYIDNSDYLNKYEMLDSAIVTPDVDIVPDTDKFEPAYLVFSNYELILKWNRSLRFALAVCTLKDKFKNEL